MVRFEFMNKNALENDFDVVNIVSFSLLMPSRNAFSIEITQHDSDTNPPINVFTYIWRCRESYFA